jgi:hypothetical protein
MANGTAGMAQNNPSWLRQHWLAALGVLFGLCCVVVSCLWFYVQLLQWKKHGDDFMLMVANVIVTGILWLMLIGTSIYFWKMSQRVQSTKAQIVTLKDGHSKQIKALEDAHKEQEQKSQKQHDSDMLQMAKLAEQRRREANQATDELAELRRKIPRSVNGVPLIGPMALAAQPKNQHNVDLQGEILEILYRREYASGFGAMVSGFLVLVRARVTNFGNDIAVVTKCDLRIDIGNNYWHGKNAAIQSGLVIERQGTGVLLQTTTTEEIVRLDAVLAQPLQKGIPHTGWIPFTISEWTEGFDFPSCGQFTLTLTDSFGGQHNIVKPCGEYAAKGKLACKKSE